MSYTDPSNVLSDGAPAPLIFARSGQSAPNENCGRRRGHFMGQGEPYRQWRQRAMSMRFNEPFRLSRRRKCGAKRRATTALVGGAHAPSVDPASIPAGTQQHTPAALYIARLLPEFPAVVTPSRLCWPRAPPPVMWHSIIYVQPPAQFKNISEMFGLCPANTKEMRSPLAN